MRMRAICGALACVGFVGALSAACGSPSAAPTVPDFDAKSQEIGFPPACETCIGQNCIQYYDSCFADAACAKVETCIGECVEKKGMMPSTCLAECSKAGTLTDFDMCIVSNCTVCTPKS